MFCTANLNSKPSLSHLQQLIWDETQTNTWIEQLDAHANKSSRSVYAPHLIQSVQLQLFKYRRGDNAHWISMNKMALMAVQWELCDTNFHENIANLQISCYNGNNYRAARVLFIQHPREQGKWLCDCIIPPVPSSAWQTTPWQPIIR